MVPTTASELAFVIVTTVLIAQGFAVFFFWLLLQFIDGPNNYEDWYEEIDESKLTLQEKVDIASKRLRERNE